MPKKVPVSIAFVDDVIQNPEFGQPQPDNFDNLYTWFEKSPELTGIITAVADDIVGEGYDLVGNDSAKEKAKIFLNQEYFNKRLYSFILDFLITGNGYLGVSKLKLSDINRFLDSESEMLSKTCDIKKTDALLRLSRKIIKQDFNSPRNLFVLRSSTININYDIHGKVLGYIQQVNSAPVDRIEFSPDEIIHFALNSVGDSIYGKSPLASSLNDVATLWYAKDYAGKFFENDATVGRIWKLIGESPDSPNYKKFTQLLTESKTKRHMNIVVTGEVETEKINDFNKDLEFATLIDKFTERLLMAWDMPPTRLSNIQGNYKTAVESNEGYYKKINRIQAELEEVLNNRLFNMFGDVKIVFRRVYKRDESREADIISKLVARPVLTINEAREILGKLPIQESKYDEIPEPLASGGSFGVSSRQTEMPSQQPNTENNPTEKISKQDKLLVDFSDLERIITQMGMPFDQAKTFYLENNGNYDILFNDGIFTYKATVPISEDFRVRYLNGAIKLQGLESDKAKVEVKVI